MIQHGVKQGEPLRGQRFTPADHVLLGADHGTTLILPIYPVLYQPNGENCSRAIPGTPWSSQYAAANCASASMRIVALHQKIFAALMRHLPLLGDRRGMLTADCSLATPKDSSLSRHRSKIIGPPHSSKRRTRDLRIPMCCKSGSGGSTALESPHTTNPPEFGDRRYIIIQAPTESARFLLFPLVFPWLPH
jgi:hypothetical protein